ncbi:MAG: hypothetical protein MJK14_09685, partial [Rivularia sp. ALOHA_DT_140]|nr:hypothetical protein [Rivularia sp. ALOHA_DT_140]
DIKIVDNFDEAYTVLDESSWDLLVTDLGLGNDDLQPQKLGKQIAEIAYRKNIPAIVVSGTDHLIPMDIRDIFTKLGASDFFYKQTFDSQEFIKKVQEVLENQPQVREDLSKIESYRLSDEDKQYIIATLSRLSANEPIGVKAFLKNLVNQLALPEDWKNDIISIWTGNANVDATTLINWGETKSSYPKESHKLGHTVLGCIAEKILAKTGDLQIFEIIKRNKLITDESKLEELKNKYSNDT